MREVNQSNITASYAQQIRELAYYGKLVRAVGLSKSAELNEQIDVLEGTPEKVCGITDDRTEAL